MATNVWVAGCKGNRIYLEGWKRNLMLPVIIVGGLIVAVVGFFLAISPLLAIAAIIVGIVQWVTNGFGTLPVLLILSGLTWIALLKLKARKK